LASKRRKKEEVIKSFFTKKIRENATKLKGFE
jgi:hypothetical protein